MDETYVQRSGIPLRKTLSQTTRLFLPLVILSIVLFTTVALMEESDGSDAATVVKKGTCGSGVSYVLYSDGILDITGNGAISNYAADDNDGSTSPWNGYYSTYVKNVRIGSGIISVGNYTFTKCTNVVSVTLASTVTSIGQYAFMGCTSLKSISIPSTVTKIDASAFRGCVSLSNINLPSSLEKLGTYAFYGCISITSISIPSSLKTIDKNVFYGCSSLKTVRMAKNVTSIGGSAFYGCTSLTDIEISTSMESIGSWAFSGCMSLKSIYLPKSVKTIETSAFYGCTSLESISIPPSITSIGTWTFCGCLSLSTVSIPASVTSIGQSAFSGCTSLQTVYNLSSLKITKGSEDYGSIGYYALNIYGNDVVGEVSNSTGSYYLLREGSTYTAVAVFPVVEKLTLPSSFTFKNTKVYTYGIGSYAFAGCDVITSLVLPSTVSSIGSHAFRDCAKLSVINLGKVTYIGAYAFYGCDSLTSVTFPALPEKNVVYIDNTFSVKVDQEGDVLEYFFVPSVTGTVTMFSSGDMDTYAYLLLDGKTLTSDDDKGSDRNFSISYRVEKGKIYTLRVKLYSPTSVGTFNVTISDSDAEVYYVEKGLVIGNNAFCGVKFYGPNSDSPLPYDSYVLAGHTFTGTGNGFLYTQDHVHIAGSPTITVYPKCLTEGKSIVRCTLCYKILENVVVPALGHSFVTVPAKAATSTTPAVKEHKECTRCGYTEYDSTTQYTVTYRVNGNIYAKQTYYGGDILSFPSSPIYGRNYTMPYGYDTYRFVGWTGATEGEPVESNLVLDAVFEGDKHIFTISYHFGEYTLNTTAEYLSKVMENPMVPTKTSESGIEYKFIGWGGYTEGMVVDRNLTFTALFEAVSSEICTVTIVYSDGTMYDVEVEKGGVISEPWHVLSYYKDEDMTKVWSHSTKVYRDITVYAVSEISGSAGNDTVWTINFFTGSLNISGTGPTSDWTARTTPWYAYRNSITSIIVGEGVTYIGNYACYKYPYLTEIILSDTVAGIGKYSLVSSVAEHVVIGSGLKNIDIRGLHGMTFYEDTVEIDIKDYSLRAREFYGVDGDLFLDSIHGTAADAEWRIDYQTRTLAIFGSGSAGNWTATTTPWYAYRGYYENVVVEDGVTEIGNYSFYANTRIKSIVMGDGVERIGANAFRGCTALVEIVFGSGLTEIGSNALTGYTFYASNGTVLKISSSVFAGHTFTSNGYKTFVCTA